VSAHQTLSEPVICLAQILHNPRVRQEVRSLLVDLVRDLPGHSGWRRHRGRNRIDRRCQHGPRADEANGGRCDDRDGDEWFRIAREADRTRASTSSYSTVSLRGYSTISSPPNDRQTLKRVRVPAWAIQCAGAQPGRRLAADGSCSWDVPSGVDSRGPRSGARRLATSEASPPAKPLPRLLGCGGSVRFGISFGASRC
jgi:hypothetical protein